MSNVCEWGGEDANIVASSNVARRGFLRRQTTTPSSSRRRLRRPFLTRTNARLLLRVSLSPSLYAYVFSASFFPFRNWMFETLHARGERSKVWRDRRRPLVLTSRVVVVQVVVAFPIDAQKWTASCFRFFRVPFHLFCAPSKRHHNRNADTCPNTFITAKPFDVEETSGAKKGKRGGGTFYDHEQQRDGTTYGKSPRGVVVARGRRAKGTNDDVFVLDGFHVIAAGHLGWGTPPFSLSLSLSLSSKANERTKRRAVATHPRMLSSSSY